MFALALGATCLLVPENQSFEAMLAFAANVFKYRHVQLSTFKMNIRALGAFPQMASRLDEGVNVDRGADSLFILKPNARQPIYSGRRITCYERDDFYDHC
jgi:hypothetical protein